MSWTPYVVLPNKRRRHNMKETRGRKRGREREREREEGEFCPRRNSGSGMQERLSWNHVDSASWQAGVTALFPWTRRVATSEISTLPPHSRSVPNDSKRDHCTVHCRIVSVAAPRRACAQRFTRGEDPLAASESLGFAAIQADMQGN